MYGSVYANTETSSLLTVEGRRVQRVSGAGSSKTMAEGGEGEDDIQFLRTVSIAFETSRFYSHKRF